MRRKGTVPTSQRDPPVLSKPGLNLVTTWSTSQWAGITANVLLQMDQEGIWTTWEFINDRDLGAEPGSRQWATEDPGTYRSVFELPGGVFIYSNEFVFA